jgi:hypothetical protein
MNNVINKLGKNMESIGNNNDIINIQKELKDIMLEDSLTAKTILEMKQQMDQHNLKIEILVRIVNYFYSYIEGSKIGNVPPRNLNNQDDTID